MSFCRHNSSANLHQNKVLLFPYSSFDVYILSFSICNAVATFSCLSNSPSDINPKDAYFIKMLIYPFTNFSNTPFRELIEIFL